MESIHRPAAWGSIKPVEAVHSTLAVLSLVAAGIHFGAIPEHVQEDVLFGLFFAIIALFQALWAFQVVLDPTPLVLALGFMVNAQIAWIWLVSRTAGIPIGPHPGVAEPIGFLDVLSTVIELAIVAACVVLLIRRRPRTDRGRSRELAFATLLLGWILLGTVALASVGHTHPGMPTVGDQRHARVMQMVQMGGH
jgi:hypothetical protein